MQIPFLGTTAGISGILPAPGLSLSELSLCLMVLLLAAILVVLILILRKR